MKRKFYSICKKAGIEILSYNSKRSDMGVQMFELSFKLPNGEIAFHDDSYFVGEKGKREKIIEYFKNHFINRYSTAPSQA